MSIFAIVHRSILKNKFKINVNKSKFIKTNFQIINVSNVKISVTNLFENRNARCTMHSTQYVGVQIASRDGTCILPSTFFKEWFFIEFTLSSVNGNVVNYYFLLRVLKNYFKTWQYKKYNVTLTCCHYQQL